MYHLCIDIDNTIAQTDAVMRRVIADVTGGRVRLEYEDVVTFNYHECRDPNGNRITKDEWNRVHDRYSDPDYLLAVEPMPGVVAGLRRLVERGAVIHFATSRLRKARKTTIEWLEARGFPDHDLHFLRHGEKHAALKRFTAAVEDDYDQAAAFAYMGDTPCYLIRHPWNRSRYRLRNVHWVDNWSELTEKLLARIAGSPLDLPPDSR